MKHFTQLNIDWLVAPKPHDFEAANDDEHIQYPFPPEAGSAQGNILKTSHSISIYTSHHEYNAALLGEDFDLGAISVSFDSDSLIIGAAFGGQVVHQEHIPALQVTYGDNLTLFRHADRFEFSPTPPTARPFDVVFCSLPITSLNLLIGQQSTEYLMNALDITTAPSVVVRSVPLRINKILKTAVSPHQQGHMKKLYSQAKILEYLCELVEHIERQNGTLYPLQKQLLMVHDIHQQLDRLEGKLPSLAELAEQAGMTAQALNQAFSKEYGMTIHRYMAKKRLEEAHSTIQETSIPLKILADRLGYSHVNHFITAFKKQFGYAPGSLRRD